MESTGTRRYDGASFMSGHCTGVQYLLEPEGYKGDQS